VRPRTADEIADEIRSAFPAIRPPMSEPLNNSMQGSEPLSIATEFQDKDDWTKLDAKWIDEAPDGWASALNFLSHEAVCFYLPAYLIADLHGRLERAEPSFQLTYGFDDLTRDQRIRPREDRTWTDYAKDRWARLTCPQVIAVVHYLEWRVANDPLQLEGAISEALDTYWRKRAASLESR
jgi:hypothetical protein